MTLSKAVLLNLLVFVLLFATSIVMLFTATRTGGRIAALFLAVIAIVGVYAFRRPSAYRVTAGPRLPSYVLALVWLCYGAATLLWQSMPPYGSPSFVALPLILAFSCIVMPWLEKVRPGTPPTDSGSKDPRSTPGVA